MERKVYADEPLSARKLPAHINVSKQLLVTKPQRSREEVIHVLQSAGFLLNGVPGDPDKIVITFEKQDPADSGPLDPWAAKKATWPDTPYVRSAGPSVQIERTGLFQERGCCGYNPPSCKAVVIHLRPADPNCGSALEKTYTCRQPGDLQRTRGCCGGPVDTWEFEGKGGGSLTFIRERAKSGCYGCCGEGVLPETGRIWTLEKDGETVAAMDIPESTETAWHCYCLPQPKGCICCGREKIPTNPMEWMRISSRGGTEPRFAIRERFKKGRSRRTGCRVKCAPQCLDCRSPSCACAPCMPLCGFCCNCGSSECCVRLACGQFARCSAACCSHYLTCFRLCATCRCGDCCSLGCPSCRVCLCVGPHCPPKGCCDPPELLEVRAEGRGVASELKGRGSVLRFTEEGHLESTHDITRRRPGSSGWSAPAQDIMVRFRFPAEKSGRAWTSGPSLSSGTRCKVNAQAQEERRKFLVHDVAVSPGTEVREGEVVAYVREQRNACGLPCCPSCSACCPSRLPRGSRASKCPCVACCLNPPCAVGPEPQLMYESAPVTGEWATPSQDTKYRVRGEVLATSAVGVGGQVISEVVAGLESGTPEEDHWAFLLAAFVELIEDPRRPYFHEEDLGWSSREGLPPRQQTMLRQTGVEEVLRTFGT